MSELPETWCAAKIGDLCELINGRAFKPEDWGEVGLPIVRIQNLNNPEAPFNHYNGEVRERFLIDSGDLLFAWSGTPGTSFGAHVWRGGKAILNQHIFNVLFNDQIVDRDFFRLAINQKLDELINKAHGGVGLRHVTKGKFEETEIALPPPSEQRRLVAKLDQLFERTTSAREELAHIPTLVEHYKQAILRKAFSGELTADWREKLGRDLPVTVQLGSEASDFSYGSAAKSAPMGKVPVLRMGNIQDGKLDWSDLVFTSDEREIEKYRLTPGDVLFNRTNSPALVGKTALYTGEQPAIYAGYLIRVRCGEGLDPRYLTYALNSPDGRDYCWQVKTDGVSQSNINAKKLAAFSFLLPEIDEQQEVVRLIESAFDWIERVSSERDKAATMLDHLDSGLLGKAFKGELVPQDSADEPAEHLLERIRSERDVQAPVRRGRRARAGA